MGRRFYLGLGLLLLLLIGGLLLSAWGVPENLPFGAGTHGGRRGGSDRGFFPGGAGCRRRPRPGGRTFPGASGF